MNVVMAYDIALANAEEGSGNILVDDSTVVYVIVQDPVKHRIPFLGPQQADSVGSYVTNLIVLDKVAQVVTFEIDRIAAHSVKVVVLYTTVLRVFQMHGIPTILPALHRKHSSITFEALMMHIVSIRGFGKGETRNRDVRDAP